MTIQAHSWEILPRDGMPRDSRFPLGQVIADGARNRQLHPFPADDPFNMPLGVNAWYAPTSDPATNQLFLNTGEIVVDPAQGVKPIYLVSDSDPITRIYRSTGHILNINHQYVSEFFIRLQSDAVPPVGDPNHWADRHLNATHGNLLTEIYRFRRDGGDLSGQLSASTTWAVQNYLDRYAFGKQGGTSAPAQNPLANNSGTRAWGGSSIAGLIRRHELDRPDPHIPHALCINLSHFSQVATVGQGPSNSPLYNHAFVFPADRTDAHGFTESHLGGSTATGAGRMGMRIALDPAVCTDAWIMANAPKLEVPTRGHPAGSPNPWQVALAKAMRDYGGIVVDTGPTRSQTEVEASLPLDIQHAVRHRNISGTEYAKHWRWMFKDGHVRRVATVVSGQVVHRPLESHWNIWRANGEGWGGGAPRVPYSGSLAPL